MHSQNPNVSDWNQQLKITYSTDSEHSILIKVIKYLLPACLEISTIWLKNENPSL